MSEVLAIKNVSFKADAAIVDLASEVFKENGYNLSKGLSLFLKNVAVKQEVSLDSEEELEKERIFLELQKEIRAGIDAYERGECIPLEEVRASLGL